MDTKKFRTRQEANTDLNPKGKRYIIGLDMGYSSVKCFFETGHFVFPSYVKKVESMVKIPDEKDILYRKDASSSEYIIGYNAQSMVDCEDTNDTNGDLLGRKGRYQSESFQILYQAALALATESKNDGRELFIQTGLPSSYLEADTGAITRALAKTYDFELRLGNGPWKKYHLVIRQENVKVMAQPSASLFSCITKNDGKFIERANELLTGNVLILDAGFGTFDFFGTKNRKLECVESTNELGMSQVLKRTARGILQDTGESINLVALQNCLEDGEFSYYDDEKDCSDTKKLAPYLQRANDAVFQEVKAKVKTTTDSLRGYRYVIVTGGSGEAWLDNFREWLKNMKTLTLLPANINDHLPLLFANARGYYMYALASAK